MVVVVVVNATGQLVVMVDLEWLLFAILEVSVDQVEPFRALEDILYTLLTVQELLPHNGIIYGKHNQFRQRRSIRINGSQVFC